MTSQQSGKLVEELRKKRLEISSLKKQLDEIDKEKESWFNKKSEHSKKIKELVSKIRENKANRDSLTNEVKEWKAKRDSLNKNISSRLDNLGKIKKGKTELEKSLGIDESPSELRRNIEKLEFKMETEPMSFDKEQALMKKIKGLKEIYKDVGVVVAAGRKLKEASFDVKKMKKDADESHALIQEKARQSQALHEDILKSSPEIDKLKAEQEEAFRKFLELKLKFKEVNTQLKDKLGETDKIKSELDRLGAEKRDKIKSEQESYLKSKEELVNEKIRKGMKLTTEDLIVFQNSKE